MTLIQVFNKPFFIFSVFLVIGISAKSQVLKTENISTNKVWLDPALNVNSNAQSVLVWFDNQFLGDGNSFSKRVEEFKGQKRSVLRKRMIETLKSISNTSFKKIEKELDQLRNEGHISKLKSHWIINGFSCQVDKEGLQAIQRLEGVAKIFSKGPPFNPPNAAIGPEYLKQIPKSTFRIDQVESYPWNIEQIRAPEVWEKHGITGKGTLNVVHDFGFKLDVAPLAENIFVNKMEIPGNNIDDDLNGYVDDYHGYNFDAGNAMVNSPRLMGTIIHGNACAAIISGGFATNSRKAIGIAPESKWAPILAVANIEDAVEWAIEQGADTYSMSYSFPNLGELRTHWRKVIEQATFCGVVFISGAGNFASGNGFAAIPVQMRIPEDIPEAVLGVAGVGQDGNRPDFSSQGPVEWMTHHYKDGTVNKPDFATLNSEIPCIDLDGSLTNIAGGNSFAGPHMAGVVSLMFSANPELLPWEIKEILKKIAKDIGKPGFDYQSGYGFVNAYDAVIEALRWKK
jgi:hypothetical protein